MTTRKLSTLILALTLVVFASCSNDNDLAPNDDLFVRIPDGTFEAILVDLGIDSDGIVNQQILKSDASDVINLNLENEGAGSDINDLAGIEAFNNLKYLAAEMHDLRSIDLSANVKLDTLYLAGNQISSIDLSNNPNLRMVDVQSNGLKTISGLSNLGDLKMLNLSFNDLESFSLHNESIEVLYVSHNLLETIDIIGSINLTNILLLSNKLKSIDLSKNSLLKTLVISGNLIENINLDQNNELTHLWISSNALLSLDVSGLSKLYNLSIHSNPNLSCVKTEEGQDIATVTKKDGQELNSSCN